MEKFMISATPNKDFAVLKVHSSFHTEDKNEFARFCSKLLDTKYSNLAMDITDVTYLSSVLCAPIVSLHFEAQAKSKTLTVICNKKLAGRFMEAGLGGILKIKVLKKK